MSGGRTHHPFRSTREQKFEYLRTHALAWRRMGGAISDDGVTAIAREMQAIGMYGKRTPFIDVRWSVRQIIEIINRENMQK